ncbi:hypothetical protein JS532_08245 [Bifidobacterium callimiconis]|nr:hypothetical protein [Bifidobacterium callimiconis]
MRKTTIMRFAATVLAIALSIGLAGCGNSEATSQATPSPSSSSNNSNSSTGNGQRIAGSLNDYIDQVMALKTTSDQQKKILQQAKQNGGITVSQYEQAWSNFKACMTSRGYPNFKLAQYNGIYSMPGLDFTGTEEQWNAYKANYDTCYNSIKAIDGVYVMQVGNPNLYSDPYEAVADCLRRSETVPNTYTAKDLQREMNEDQGSGENPYQYFDRKNATFRGCKAANGWTTTYADDERVNLWQ